MAGRWNLWCMVTMYRYGYSGCCCKEVYTDILTIIFNFPYFTCIFFFFHFKNVFLSCLCYFCTIYSKRYSKNIRDR